MNQKSRYTNALTVGAAHTKRNAQNRKGTSACMYQRNLSGNVRLPMRTS